VHLRKKCQTTIAELSDEKAHQQIDYPWTRGKPTSYFELLLYTMRQLWVAGTQALTVFDDRTGRLLARVPLAEDPQYLSIPPGSGTVYVTTRQGTVDAVDIETRQARQLLTGGSFGTMDFDERGGKVAMIDLLERQVIYTVLVTGTPRFIITGLYPPAYIPNPISTPSTQIPLMPGTGSNILPKIVFSAIAIMILTLVFFLARQIRIFLRPGTKSKHL
jgi:hypothetical protein